MSSTQSDFERVSLGTPAATQADRNGIDIDKAVRNYPRSELLMISKYSPAVFQSKSADSWVRELVINRIHNAICNHCLKKDDTPLFYCPNCHCTWFCSTECQVKDAKHSKWCCNPDAPPDDGPMKLLFIDTHANNNDDKKKIGIVALAIKDKGNERYNEGDFKTALQLYSQATRVCFNVVPADEVVRSCWLNKCKAYAAMELWHLAAADIKMLEVGYQWCMTTLKDNEFAAKVFTKMKLFKLVEARYKAMQMMELIPADRAEAAVRIAKGLNDSFTKKQQKEMATLMVRSGSTVVDIVRAMGEEYKPKYKPCLEKLFHESPGGRAKYIQDINAIFPNVEIKQSSLSSDAGMGSFMRTAIKKDELILADMPYAFDSVDVLVCARCGKKDISVPCKANCGEKYCSEKCREWAVKQWHTWQCDKEIQAALQETRKRIKEHGKSASSRITLLIMRLLGMVARETNVLTLPVLQSLASGTTQGEAFFLQSIQQYERVLSDLKLSPACFDFYTFDYLRFCLSINVFAASPNQGILSDGVGIYGLATQINHSCEPNASWEIVKHPMGDNVLVILAERDLKEGEEITISYFDTTGKNYQDRQNALVQYGFVCQCSKCKAEKPPSE